MIEQLLFPVLCLVAVILFASFIALAIKWRLSNARKIRDNIAQGKYKSWNEPPMSMTIRRLALIQLFSLITLISMIFLYPGVLAHWFSWIIILGIFAVVIIIGVVMYRKTLDP